MKGILRLLLMLAAISPLSLRAQGIADVISALRNVPCYNATVEFIVAMPQLADDITYSVDIEAHATPADPLMPCAYLLEWQLNGRENNEGFAAYYDGHHYRYSGERLQEYHVEWDSISFMPRRLAGINSDGVQRSAQFVNLLPAVMADELTKYLTDEAYRVTFHPDTLISGAHMVAADVVMLINDQTAMEAEYVFHPETLMPWRMHFENNPGSVSEQTVDVSYTDWSIPEGDNCLEIDETRLIDEYPDVFENYRQSNFRIENLRGRHLPGFAIPTTTGERYMRRTSDGFANPTLLVLLDAQGGYSRNVVEDVRAAAAQMPVQADVIWAFTDNNIDRIESVSGAINPGEHLLMSARGLARDCGASSLPVIIICNTDGIVADLILGYNNNLVSDVIQKMALMQ